MADLLFTDALAKVLVTLTPTGDKGSESRACVVAGRPDVVGLVPNDGGAYPPADGEKIVALVDAGHRDPHIAFPTTYYTEPHCPDLVFGFEVPKAAGNSLDDAIAGLRDVKERLALAKNLTAPFKASERLHTYLIDNHAGNYLVGPGLGPVVRIDPLGLVVQYGRWHVCTVARPESLEPELVGVADLATATVDRYSARFGLALLLFEVLTGTHPAVYSVPGEVVADLPGRVMKRHFAFHRGCPANATVNADVKRRFLALPDRLRQMFETAFLGDRRDRPSPEDWERALAAAGAPQPSPAAGPLGAPAGPRWGWNWDRDRLLALADEKWRALAAAVLCAFVVAGVLHRHLRPAVDRLTAPPPAAPTAVQAAFQPVGPVTPAPPAKLPYDPWSDDEPEGDPADPRAYVGAINPSPAKKGN